MSRSTEIIRIPRLRLVVLAVTSLVVIGLGVFLRRYRGADRTAMALSVLAGAGFCLMLALVLFEWRFRGEAMPRGRLWGIGMRYGAVVGACTPGVALILLAVRWALDQQAGPVGDPFVPGFLRALNSLGSVMSLGLLAYLVVGAVVGGLCGLGVAEAIGISAEHPATPENGIAPAEESAEFPSGER